jgi:hypothetical protein
MTETLSILTLNNVAKILGGTGRQSTPGCGMEKQME